MGWMGCALKAQHSFLHTKVESETLKSHGSFCIRSFCGLVVFSQNCSYTVDLYPLITNTGPSVCSFYGIVKQLEKLTGLNDAYKHGICHLCRIKRNAVITCIKFNKSQHENTVEQKNGENTARSRTQMSPDSLPIDVSGKTCTEFTR